MIVRTSNRNWICGLRSRKHGWLRKSLQPLRRGTITPASSQSTWIDPTTSRSRRSPDKWAGSCQKGNCPRPARRSALHCSPRNIYATAGSKHGRPYQPECAGRYQVGDSNNALLGQHASIDSHGMTDHEARGGSTRADIHDGPEQRSNERPDTLMQDPSPRSTKNPLQRTAGPYIGLATSQTASATGRQNTTERMGNIVP